MWTLYIDDIRNPKNPQDWTVVARNSEQAIQATQQYGVIPVRISFDHDLGGDDTSMVYVHWLVNSILDGDIQRIAPEKIQWSVHSANPIGRDNLESMIKNIIDHLL